MQTMQEDTAPGFPTVMGKAKGGWFITTEQGPDCHPTADSKIWLSCCYFFGVRAAGYNLE